MTLILSFCVVNILVNPKEGDIEGIAGSNVFHQPVPERHNGLKAQISNIFNHFPAKTDGTFNELAMGLGMGIKIRIFPSSKQLLLGGEKDLSIIIDIGNSVGDGLCIGLFLLHFNEGIKYLKHFFLVLFLFFHTHTVCGIPFHQMFCLSHFSYLLFSWIFFRPKHFPAQPGKPSGRR